MEDVIRLAMREIEKLGRKNFLAPLVAHAAACRRRPGGWSGTWRLLSNAETGG